MRVEHSIAGVKVFRSRGIYRNFKAGFEDALNETACGLHNLRSDFPIEAGLKAAMTPKTKTEKPCTYSSTIYDKA